MFAAHFWRTEGWTPRWWKTGQIVQEVVAGIKEKVSVHEGEMNDSKNPVEQSFMRTWDCSQIEEEEEESWRERVQMAAQWVKGRYWRRSWNKEGWKEALCIWRLREMYPSKLCMNVCHKALG